MLVVVWHVVWGGYGLLYSLLYGLLCGLLFNFRKSGAIGRLLVIFYKKHLAFYL